MKTYFLFTELLAEHNDLLLKYENYIVDGKADTSGIDNLKEAFYIERTGITVIVLDEETERRAEE